MNNSSLINPYNLLGIKPTCTLRELKKNYYGMALLCHPDKGGDEKDMNIVCLAYNYIKEQLENIKDSTYEELEYEFEKFCKEQESKTVPDFGKIYEETNDWIVDFNKAFEDKTNLDLNSINPYKNNPFEIGYGNIMDDEKIINKDYKDIENSVPKNLFKREIVEYKEPEALPNMITHYPLEQIEINDFSDYNENLSDYKIAFFEPEKLKSKCEKDYPKNNIDYCDLINN